MEVNFEAHDLEITGLAITRSIDPRGQIDPERLLRRLLLSTSEVLRNGTIVLSESAQVDTISQMMLRRKQSLMQDYPNSWEEQYQSFLRHQILYIVSTMIQRQARYLYNVPSTYIV